MSKRNALLKHHNFILRLALTLFLLSLLAVLGLFRWLVVDLPDPNQLYQRNSADSTRIFDRRHNLLYVINDPHMGVHSPLPLKDIPLPCRQAVIATEDATFYSNPGVDVKAILRAVWINIQGGEVLSGGSTITQQLARNLLLSPEERTSISLSRKLREAILAWRIARSYNKDEILTLYLNETYYGNLAYGIQAASRIYFGKNVGELDLAECSLLAGLPQSPAKYNPLENPEAAKQRQAVVLNLMVKQGFIGETSANLAGREKLSYAPISFPIKAPHFVMYVWNWLERQFGPEAIFTQGLQVQTTLDLDMENTAERIARYRLEQLSQVKNGQPARQVRNAALVAVNPATGEILTMMGSPDYFDPRINGAVNAAIAMRQPGSSIKPITYAAAFDPAAKYPFTAGSMLMDVRTSFLTREGEPYLPQNYDRKYHGPVLLREALATSNNVIAVKVLDHVGLEPMLKVARSLGLTTFDRSDNWGLSLTLGGGEVRLVELTSAYAAFANAGKRVDSYAVESVSDAGGRLLYTHLKQPQPQAIDERVAYLITDILSDNYARSGAFGEGSPLNLTRPAAAKTGTTTDWRDNWTVGYTPQLAVGVWAGNVDNEPMRFVSGIDGAAPIWHDFMEEVHSGKPVLQFTKPAGLTRVEICADNGLLPLKQTDRNAINQVRDSAITPIRCPRTYNELFIKGTEPTVMDNWHARLRLDRRNNLLAASGCGPEFTTERLFTYYPAEALAWAQGEAIPLPPTEYSPYCGGGQNTKVGLAMAHMPSSAETDCLDKFICLRITSPDQGSSYRQVRSMPPEQQQLKFSLVPLGGVEPGEVEMMVDGKIITRLPGPLYEAFWELTPGQHTFSARGKDRNGNTIFSNPVQISVGQD